MIAASNGQSRLSLLVALSTLGRLFWMDNIWILIRFLKETNSGVFEHSEFLFYETISRDKLEMVKEVMERLWEPTHTRRLPI